MGARGGDVEIVATWERNEKRERRLRTRVRK
jgi:hypothetical protein